MRARAKARTMRDRPAARASHSDLGGPCPARSATLCPVLSTSPTLSATTSATRSPVPWAVASATWSLKHGHDSPYIRWGIPPSCEGPLSDPRFAADSQKREHSGRSGACAGSGCDILDNPSGLLGQHRQPKLPLRYRHTIPRSNRDHFRRSEPHPDHCIGFELWRMLSHQLKGLPASCSHSSV